MLAFLVVLAFLELLLRHEHVYLLCMATQNKTNDHSMMNYDLTLPTLRPISNARYASVEKRVSNFAGMYSSAGKIPCVGLLSNGANSVAARL